MEYMSQEDWYLSSLRIHPAGILEIDAVFTIVTGFHERL